MIYGDDEPDSQASVRRANLRKALQLVFRNSGVETRAGIARATGLTAATASSLVAELIETRLVVEGGQAASTGGKRATTLSIDASHHLVLALIIRPTDALAALVSLDGATVYEERITYTPSSRDRAISVMLTRIAERFRERLLVVSVQVTGATDGRIVLESVQLDLRDDPLAETFEGILGVPVYLVNDVDAEAIAEGAMNNEASGYRLFIHIGTGVGASVTLDGIVTPGPNTRGGEIGHVQVVFGNDARLCRCGLHGCVEAAFSMTAMLGPDFEEGMDDDEVAELIAVANPAHLAMGAIALARTIKLLSAMIDPDEVVIGGFVDVLGESFLEAVRAGLAYESRGTTPVPVRYASRKVEPHAGVAQYALSTALGVRWTPEQLMI